jgi:hypothetical protein
LDIKRKEVKINIDSFFLEKGAFVLYKLKVSLLLNFGVKLSNQKRFPNKVSVWHIAVLSHRRINITNNGGLHTKPFPKLLSISVLRALRMMQTGRQRKTWEMFWVTEFACSSTMVLRNVSAMAHAPHLRFEVYTYHYSYTLNVPVFRERIHVYAPGKLNIPSSPKKYNLHKLFKTLIFMVTMRHGFGNKRKGI